MRPISRSFFALALAASVPFCSELNAQSSETPEKIASELRANDRLNGHALKLLTQTGRSYAQARLDLVADTLVAIAISSSAAGRVSGDITAEQRAGNAIKILRRAGAGEGGAPYVGASTKLMRVALSGEPVSTAAALALSSLPNRAQALVDLRRLASLNTYAAPTAVHVLAEDLAPAGLNLLRELYKNGLVTHPLAKARVDALARHYGWN